MERNNFLKLKPMLLNESQTPFNNEDYIFELKFDGIRTLIFIDKNKITIRSRNGVLLNSIYPELENIKKISKDKCIFDGEIVLLKNGKPSFSKVMERFKLKDTFKIKKKQIQEPVSFVCFDILYRNKDLTGYSLIERKKILEKIKDNDYFIKSKFIDTNGKDLFDVVKKEKLEGIVAKKKDSKYFYGIRSKDWLKIKNWIQEIFYICGYETVDIKNTIKILLCEKRNNEFYYVGKVIMNVKNKLYNKIISEKIINNYLKNYDSNKTSFIKTKHKIKINYIERTKDNMLREAFILK